MCHIFLIFACLVSFDCILDLVSFTLFGVVCFPMYIPVVCKYSHFVLELGIVTL